MFLCFLKHLVAVELQLQQSFQKNIKKKKFFKFSLKIQKKLNFLENFFLKTLKNYFLKISKKIKIFFLKTLGVLQLCSSSIRAATGLFYVAATFKINVVLVAVEEVANLRSFECVGIQKKYSLFSKNAIIMLMHLSKRLNQAETG